MKRLFILFLFSTLAHTLAHAGTWTFVQGVRSSACTTGSATCTVTLSGVTGGAKDAVAVFAGAAVNASITISSATIGSDNFTLVPASGCAIHPSTTTAAVDCAYIVGPTAAGTLVTVNLGGAPGAAWNIYAVEVKNTVNIAYDTAGTSGLTVAGVSAVGPTLTLGGANDAILNVIRSAGGTVSSIDTGYTQCSAFTATVNCAYLINTATGTGPTWTQTSAKAAMDAIAFKESSAVVVRRQAAVIQSR